MCTVTALCIAPEPAAAKVLALLLYLPLRASQPALTPCIPPLPCLASGQCTQVATSCPLTKGSPAKACHPRLPGCQTSAWRFITKGGLKAEAVSLSCQTSPGARCRRHNSTTPLQRR